MNPLTHVPPWRGVLGVLYLAAAVFNAVFTLPRSHELHGYAEGAWFGFLEDLMWDVFLPNGEVFMGLVIVFEVAVGLVIVSKGSRVDVGVLASVLWVLVILPFLAYPYLLMNIGLAVVQGTILLRRYPNSMWGLLRPQRAVAS